MRSRKPAILREEILTATLEPLLPIHTSLLPGTETRSDHSEQFVNRLNTSAYRKSSNHREMEPLEDKERGCCQGFVAFLLGLALFSSQLVIFGVVALTVYWVFKFKGGIDLEKDPLQQFNTHIIAMIVGFVFFCGQAILAYRVFDCCKRSYSRVIHFILQLCGTICISAGFYVTYMNTHNKAQNHFRSLHTWLALATCSLFCLQFVFAILFFIIPLCCRRKTFAFRQKMMPVHASFGLILFTMFSGTAITGFMQAQEEPLILPPTYNQTAENILSLIPGKPEQQSDLIVKILGCGILVLGVFLSAVTNTSIRGGRGVFYRT